MKLFAEMQSETYSSVSATRISCVQPLCIACSTSSTSQVSGIPYLHQVAAMAIRRAWDLGISLHISLQDLKHLGVP